MEDLHNVILVGHSYAGTVIAGVADRIPERLSKLVYLDAILVENGQSALSIQPPAVEETIRKSAAKDGGLSIPAWPAKVFGVKDTADARWVDAKDWQYYELQTGHDAMMTAPVETAALLQSFAK